MLRALRSVCRLLSFIISRNKFTESPTPFHFLFKCWVPSVVMQLACGCSGPTRELAVGTVCLLEEIHHWLAVIPYLQVENPGGNFRSVGKSGLLGNCENVYCNEYLWAMSWDGSGAAMYSNAQFCTLKSVFPQEERILTTQAFVVQTLLPS